MESESEETTGEVGSGSRELPHGRVLPLNSKRLTSAHLKQVAEKLELPTTGSADQIRQLIEGKLQEDREVSNIQVIVQESTYRELGLSLIDEDGVFLETDPATKSEEDAALELAELTEANQRTTTLSEDTARLLEEERKRTAELKSKIAEYEGAEGHGDMKEIKKLKSDLKAAKDKAKQMWTLSCSQSREQEEQIAALEAEVALLKVSKSRETSGAGSPSTSGRSSPIIPAPETVHIRPTRRGKAPPVDAFTGEDPAVNKVGRLVTSFKASIALEWVVARGRANPAGRTPERPCSSGVGSVER